jgi:hypothetical protein
MSAHTQKNSTHPKINIFELKRDFKKNYPFDEELQFLS